MCSIIKTEEKKENTNKKSRWKKKNPAWIQMKWEVAEGFIGESTDFATAQTIRALYQEMDKDLFKSRLTGMRKQVKKAKGKAAVEAELLKHDRLVRPAQLITIGASQNGGITRQRSSLKTI